MKIKEIEKLLIQHLQESGEIRSNLKMLTKAYWILTTAFVTGVIAILVNLVFRTK